MTFDEREAHDVTNMSKEQLVKRVLTMQAQLETVQARLDAQSRRTHELSRVVEGLVARVRIMEGVSDAR